MLEIAALSFLGFGAKPPTPEWGYMLNEGRACMQSAPWMMLYPGLAIFLVVVVFNMLGDSIRDILLGDIISGSLRLVEAILMAAVLALGMMAAIWLMGGIA